MITEAGRGRAAPAGADLRAWRPGATTHRRSLVAVGLGVLVSLVLVGLSVAAGAFLVHTASAVLFGNGQLTGGNSAPTATRQTLKLQSGLIERRQAAVAAYAATLTAFKAATLRPANAPGINLDATETRRRDDALGILVLECIDAVNMYNLAAPALSATQLRSSGLPERFVWAVDCATTQ